MVKGSKLADIGMEFCSVLFVKVFERNQFEDSLTIQDFVLNEPNFTSLPFSQNSTNVITPLNDGLVNLIQICASICFTFLQLGIRISTLDHVQIRAYE